MPLMLTDDERAMLDGVHGPAAAMAMRIVTRTAEAMGAPALLDIDGAHVDGCLYHGQAGLDFAERLASLGGTVRVPTTLNVSSLDLLHPDLVRLSPDRASDARRLMDAYVALGCRPTWTCAPYQLPDRPRPGAQLAWAESNAIVFANSVLGARTERYGDFMDVCCAITGRAPAVGLHTDEGRRASLVVIVEGVSEELARSTAGLAALGHRVGALAGRRVPAVVGLPHHLEEDGLKALGAAAASAGSVALVHVVGSTPEAPTLEAILVDGSDAVTIRPDDLRDARDELTTAREPRIGAVCLGTPHASLAELRSLLGHLRETGRPTVPCYVNTSRANLEALGGRRRRARELGSHRRDRHLHVRDADPRGRRWRGHDRLREMGLVRADQPRLRRGLRDHRGMSALGRRAAASGETTRCGSVVTSIRVTRVLVPGAAEGDVLVLAEPLSFWGGLDPDTGVVTDARHPQRGAVLTGTVVVMRTGRGSSSSASVLAEAIRARTGPAAIVLAEADPIVVLGALVAGELYGSRSPSWRSRTMRTTRLSRAPGTSGSPMRRSSRRDTDAEARPTCGCCAARGSCAEHHPVRVTRNVTPPPTA